MIRPEQLMVYQVVEKAGNKGIWQKDIRSATGLQQNVSSLHDHGPFLDTLLPYQTPQGLVRKSSILMTPRLMTTCMILLMM
jgi:hypothetical protein